MKNFKVTGIEWDCDGIDPMGYGLPKTTTIEAKDENSVIDELSNMYGFCVLCVGEIIEQD